MTFLKYAPVAALLVSAAASAAPATFALIPANSVVTISGTVAGVPIQQQGPGSLTTTYFGTALADLTPSSVQFINGGNAAANNNGTWQPAAGGVAGSAPASYGAQVNLGIFGTARLAIRNLAVDGSSAPLALSGNSFPASGVTMIINTGTADYSSTLFTGSDELAGNTGPNNAPGDGSLAIVVNTSAVTATATLTLPLQATFVDEIAGIGPATLNFNGQISGSVTSIGGDANFDRVVDISDFATLSANFNRAGGWLSGNFDDAGLVDIADFAILTSNFNEIAPRGAVPEPATATGAVCAVYLLLRRRVSSIAARLD